MGGPDSDSRQRYNALDVMKLPWLILLIAATALGGNAPINYETTNHAVKKPLPVTVTPCDYDFTGLNVCGLVGTGFGTVTSITATSPIVVTPDPITTTGTISFDGSGFELPLTFSDSVIRTVNDVTLVNDSASPGNSMYYGTDGTGTKGFFLLPATPATVTHAVTFVVDGAGQLITTGVKAYIKIPYGGTLQGWDLIGAPVGSVTLDIYRATDTNGLPSASIVGGSGTKPALSSAVENKSTSFTNWTSTTLNAHDNLAVSLSGIVDTTYVALTLYYQ